MGLQISRDQIQPFDEILVGFSGDQVEVRGYVDLRTTFTNEHATKTIVIRYMMLNAPWSYKLGAVVSTTHLKPKFLTEGKVVTMKVDQEVARKCYENSMRTRRSTYSIAQVPTPISEEEPTELDPRMLEDLCGPKPVGELRIVEIGRGKTVQIRVDLDCRTESELHQVLRANLASFAWTAKDMSGIDLDIICHRLNVNSQIKAKIQRRRRLNDEKAKAATKEIQKLNKAGHIREI